MEYRPLPDPCPALSCCETFSFDLYQCLPPEWGHPNVIPSPSASFFPTSCSAALVLTPVSTPLLSPHLTFIYSLPGWLGMLMEAVDRNRFKSDRGFCLWQSVCDRSSGPGRVMCSWVRRASCSLGPSASSGNLSLAVSEGHSRPCYWSSSTPLNFYDQLSVSELKHSLCFSHFYIVLLMLSYNSCFFFVFFYRNRLLI